MIPQCPSHRLFRFIALTLFAVLMLSAVLTAFQRTGARSSASSVYIANEGIGDAFETRPGIVWMRGGYGAFAHAFEVEYTPDGQHVVTLDSTHLKIFRVSDEQLTRSIPLTQYARTMDISADGQLVAVGIGTEGSNFSPAVKIYRLADGALQQTIPLIGAPTSVVFSPDANGGLKVLCNEYRPNTTSLLKLWSVTDGSLIRDFSSGTVSRYTNGKPFSLDGTKVAVHYQNGYPYYEHHINVLSVANGTVLNTFDAMYYDYSYSYSFSANGQLLAGANHNGVFVYPLSCISNCTTVATFSLPINGERPTDVAFSPDGQKLAAGSHVNQNLGSVNVWSVPGWSSLRRYQVTSTDDKPAVAFSPNNQTIAAGYELQLRDVGDATGATTRKLASPTSGNMYSLAYSPDGQTLATGTSNLYYDGSNPNIRLWNAANDRLCCTQRKANQILGRGNRQSD